MKQEKEIAIQFLKMVAKGKVNEAYENYLDKNFKHHNPYFKKDISDLKKAMQEDADQNPEKELKILRAMADEEGVAVHSIVQQNPSHKGFLLAHFFKFQNGKITELWDLAQEVPEDMINENGVI